LDIKILLKVLFLGAFEGINIIQKIVNFNMANMPYFDSLVSNPIGTKFKLWKYLSLLAEQLKFQIP